MGRVGNLSNETNYWDVDANHGRDRTAVPLPLLSREWLPRLSTETSFSSVCARTAQSRFTSIARIHERQHSTRAISRPRRGFSRLDVRRLGDGNFSACGASRLAADATNGRAAG